MNHDLELLTPPGSDGEYTKSLPDALPATKLAGDCGLKNKVPRREYQWFVHKIVAELRSYHKQGVMLFKHNATTIPELFRTKSDNKHPA